MYREDRPTSMTFAEKVFARASGVSSVKAGEGVYPEPELVIIHDAYLGAAFRELSDIGYERITRPDRVVAVTDHEVLAASPQSAVRARANAALARKWRLGSFYDAGQGGHGHVFPMEDRLVTPGMFVSAYDMHCSNFGAIGAYAMAASQDVTVILATGSKLTTVPETVVVHLDGTMQHGVHSRDVGFRLAHDLLAGVHGVSVEACVMEFQGDAANDMPISARIGLINTLTEIDVANILFPPRHFDGAAAADMADLPTGVGASLRGRIALDLGSFGPTVALPGAPHNAAEIGEAAGQAIDHAFIGACGSSNFDDFRAAAEVMNGRNVAAGVRFFVVPGTVKIARRMMSEGLSQVFLDAGAIILPPGCGPCAGGLMAPLAAGEVSISTAATNNKGRMGSSEAECFLASPLSVAAAAVAGRIIDPREVMA